ncbi:Inhibitor of growth protein 3 [Dissostichus eleginoides]|uniref:Inhibitor of growth protein 3 n=1 Tax=Dissostichus eleginoides TaxID=100907 RepID=A0AAD9B0P1_DISEL|nr:Inhibitor of growth protein 3 [Dissostichus eleginoides]
MLYLEDYLEMIEQLPIDLRDRFTEMREMDLQVQNATDQLEQKVIEFFVNAKKNKPEWREEQMEVIKKDYYKALEDADEKVQLANQIYDLVDRHLRKLDQELAKFKMELEADNAGITEILERRSLEMDSPSQPVNNHHAHSHTATEKHVPEKKFKSEALLSTLTSDASKENTPGCRSNITSCSTPSSSVYSVTPPQPLYSSLPAGPGAVGAISLAAAQAVQATAQMKDGRRTSSLKASYEAIKNTDFQLSREFSLSRENRENPGFSSSALANTLTSTLTPSPAADSRGPLPEAEANSQVDWTYDPNEPRYCICNQVSYGEMVGCDNTDWFHYGCVGLTEAPKGKWFCPQCTAAMKRRGSRHK